MGYIDKNYNKKSVVEDEYPKGEEFAQQED
jgi:hypothetical protein